MRVKWDGTKPYSPSSLRNLDPLNFSETVRTDVVRTFDGNGSIPIPRTQPEEPADRTIFSAKLFHDSTRIFFTPRRRSTFFFSFFFVPESRSAKGPRFAPSAGPLPGSLTGPQRVLAGTTDTGTAGAQNLHNF